MLFINESDLSSKLNGFKTYFNNRRAHASLEMKTPEAMATKATDNNQAPFDSYRWESHYCRLYKLPIAA